MNTVGTLDRCSVRYAVLLTAAAGLLFLPGLGARDFWAPGEPIYAEAVRIMFEKHNWWVPTVNGQLYADKPVLYFWLALVISQIAGGVSEWTARLPSALGGIGMVLTTYHFGKTFYDRETGLFAGMILATTSRVLWESRFLRLDTVLSFFLMLGLYFFLKAALGKSPRRTYLLAYLCFALATLTKGPIGLILPGGAILGWIALTGRWGQFKEMLLPSGVILIVLVIGPWLALLHFRGEDQWLHDFIWIHNVQNYALEPIGHIRPFYYYFVNLPPDFLPWTLLLPGAVVYYYPWRRPLREPASLALLCWFAAVFLFFTSSKSKIAYYLIPLLPVPALFLANYFRALLQREELHGAHWRFTRASFYGLAFLLLFSGIALPFVVTRIERPLLSWSLALASLMVAGAGAMIFSLRQKQLRSLLASFVGFLVGLSVIAFIGVLPYLDRYKSPRPVGEFIRKQVDSAAPVYVFQSTMSDFNYYAGRERLPVIPSWDELSRLAVSKPSVFLLVDEKDLKTMDPARSYEVLKEQRVGEKKWYVLRIPGKAS